MSEKIILKNQIVTIEMDKVSNEHAIYVFLDDNLILSKYGTEDEIVEKFQKIKAKLMRVD